VGGDNTPTWEMLLEYLGISLKINIVAFIIYIPLGIIIGILTGIYSDSWFDRLLTNALLIINSIPIFILMFLLIFYIGYHLKIGHYQYVSGWGARNYILPVFALVLAPISRISRVIRSEMIESIHSDYVMLARVKGMSLQRALLRHSSRQSIGAVIQVVPDVFLFALMGSVFVEIIYHIPGVAILLIRSLVRVSPMGGLYIYIELEMVMVILLFYSILSIGMNIISDLLLLYIDPRIRFE
jgi:oligopeptide transport system permease protein